MLKYILSIMITLKVMSQPINQTWSIMRVATEAVPITWEKVFADAKYELEDVSAILDEQERSFGQYYPLKKDIFAAFHYTPLNAVKIVILGQDPYHQTISLNGSSMCRAIGMSFSVRREDSIPSSLQNIYSELVTNVRGFTKPDHGDLRDWARQGILLLNSCLTVRPGQAGSHGDIWLGFMNKVFKELAIVNPYCIYMLWGREAQKLKPMLGERSIILEAAHPSGLSAKRGFFGCNHFNLANEALLKQKKTGINWRISPLVEPTLPRRIYPPSPTKSVLVPVNPTLLPSLITFKLTAGVPTILGSTTTATNSTKSPSPTNPNNIPTIIGSPNNTPKSDKSDKSSPIIPTTPILPSNRSPSCPIPQIPIINFGTTTTTTQPTQPSTLTGVPQIITSRSQSEDNQQTRNSKVLSSMPVIIGLPTINPLVF